MRLKQDMFRLYSKKIRLNLTKLCFKVSKNKTVWNKLILGRLRNAKIHQPQSRVSPCMKPIQNQLDWVLIAKGIGIILVVVGHFIPASSPGYWLSFRQFIYSFHMPLFFLLSGYLYNPGKHSYTNLLKNKTKRLLYPFVTVAGFFLSSSR